MRFPFMIICIMTACLLQSCQFSCSLGDKDTEVSGNLKNPRLKNEIRLREDGVRVEKAYLIFQSGKRVPEGNVVDFSEPVKLIIVIEDGWKEVDGRVRLGASEKIEIENEGVMLDEADLFAEGFENGMSPEDAKTIALSATIRLKKQVAPLKTFLVSFKVWDKNGPGFVEGSYKLYAK